MAGFTIFLSLVLIAAGAAGAHFYFLAPLAGLALTGAGLALLVLLFFYAVIDFIRFRGRDAHWLALLLGLTAIAVAGGAGILANKNPVWDVTTDTKNPPKFVHAAYPFRLEKGIEYLDASLRLERPYESGEAQAVHLPSLAPTIAYGSPAEIYPVLLASAKERLPDAKLVLDDPKAFHAEWEAEDPLYRSVVDIAAEVRSASPVTVELRVRNRLAFPDFGYSAWLLRELQSQIAQTLEKRPAAPAPAPPPAAAPPPANPVANTKTGAAPAAPAAAPKAVATPPAVKK
jgi:hypothetical protein